MTEPALSPPSPSDPLAAGSAAAPVDYAQFLQQTLPSQSFNVVRYELPGESVWLKKAGPSIAACAICKPAACACPRCWPAAKTHF